MNNDRVFVSDNVIVAGSGRGLGATRQDFAQFGATHGGGYPTGVDEILNADGFYSRSATPNNTWSPFELANGCDGGADFGFGDGLFPQFHSGLAPGSWWAPAEPTPGVEYADPPDARGGDGDDRPRAAACLEPSRRRRTRRRRGRLTWQLQ